MEGAVKQNKTKQQRKVVGMGLDLGPQGGR